MADTPRTDAVKDYDERCKLHGDRIVTHAMCFARVCEEVDELRELSKKLERELTASQSQVAELTRDAVLLAAATAHRGCCGTEHDPANGKLHGYCVVCGVPWPCDTAKVFIDAASGREGK